MVSCIAGHNVEFWTVTEGFFVGAIQRFYLSVILCGPWWVHFKTVGGDEFFIMNLTVTCTHVIVMEQFCFLSAISLFIFNFLNCLILGFCHHWITQGTLLSINLCCNPRIGHLYGFDASKGQIWNIGRSLSSKYCFSCTFYIQFFCCFEITISCSGSWLSKWWRW